MKVSRQERNKVIDYLLNKCGERKEDIPQVLKAQKIAQFYYSKETEIEDKKISCEEAYRLLGFETFWSGIDRAAYHWTAVRNINEKELIFIDCSSMFKNLLKRSC